MIDQRILEILQAPDSIEEKDLNVLQSNIRKYPYIQSLRALFLYGTHRFQSKNYQQELSTTAAYTTDKKILYQFVNHKKTTEVETDDKPTDFYTVQSPKEIEKEAENIEFPKTKEAEVFSKEETISEISLEKQKSRIEDSVALNFHGTEDFLPNVKMEIKKPKANYEIPKPKLSRHEEEMQRLIAEVEAKVKANREAKKQLQSKEKEINIHFAEAQNSVKENKIEEKIKKSTSRLNITENSNSKISTTETSETKKLAKKKVYKTEWKPMNFKTNTPDCEIGSRIKTQEEQENKHNSVDKTQFKNEWVELPVMNVSFLKEESTIIPDNPKEKVQEDRPIVNNLIEVKAEEKNSNIPQFISTWQNWLKLSHIPKASSTTVNKKELTKKETDIDAKNNNERIISHNKVEEIKQKAIEKFIKTEPKISKLKEKSDFTLKEKSDDISHLITETLAKIYLEQRLYSKATKAYEILKEKYPEKKVFFDEKIQEIKALQSNHK